MEAAQSLALGIRLALTTTADGGRERPLVDSPDQSFSYRPNWGLPTMDASSHEQTGAPVYRFSSPTVEPGGTALAVIVPLYPELIPRWRSETRPGVVLPMYEGHRVCGHGTVLWVEDVRLPLGASDQQRFDAWLVRG